MSRAALQPPPGVPADAMLAGDEWEHASVNARGEREGLRRVWTTAGVLVEEGEWRAGRRHGLFRFFDDAGNLERVTDMADDRKDGRWWSRVPPGTYADAKIESEKGGFHEDFAIGPWTFAETAGRVRRMVDFGIPRAPGDVEASPAFEDLARDAGAWNALASELFAGRQVGEALCACARAAAVARDPAPLRAALLRHTGCLGGETASGAAEDVLRGAGDAVPALVNALVRGASAPSLLRGVATALDGRGASRAALDFADAALLLTPRSADARVTRALVLASLGRVDAAREDAEALYAIDAARGVELADWLRVVFPRFDFWPSRVVPESSLEGLPEAPAQPESAIRAVAKKYAARLDAIRAALASAGVSRDAEWMPPDVTGATGGVDELARGSFSVDGEEIAVDERVALAGLSLPALLAVARAEWAAFCWLLWSAGASGLVLPQPIDPPKDFGVAVGMSIERLHRCRSGSGLRWEGLDLASAPPRLVAMAERECAETQAVFHWLADARNRSPWQDNLRRS